MDLTGVNVSLDMDVTNNQILNKLKNLSMDDQNVIFRKVFLFILFEEHLLMKQKKLPMDLLVALISVFIRRIFLLVRGIHPHPHALGQLLFARN